MGLLSILRRRALGHTETLDDVLSSKHKTTEHILSEVLGANDIVLEKIEDDEYVDRLKSAGFVSCKEVMEYESSKKSYYQHMRIKEILEKYENVMFITEDKFRTIETRHGIKSLSLHDYTGSVPERILRAVETFPKLDDRDLIIARAETSHSADAQEITFFLTKDDFVSEHHLDMMERGQYFYARGSGALEWEGLREMPEYAQKRFVKVFSHRDDLFRIHFNDKVVDPFISVRIKEGLLLMGVKNIECYE